MPGDSRTWGPDGNAVDFDVEPQKARSRSRSRAERKPVQSGADPRERLLNEAFVADIEREARRVEAVGDGPILRAHLDRTDERRAAFRMQIAVRQR